MEIISSSANPRIKRLVKLNKSSKMCKEDNVFLVEGIRMFREVPEGLVKEVYVSESGMGKFGEELKELGFESDDRRVTVTSDSLFTTISNTKTPQGIMAVVERINHSLEDVLQTLKTTKTSSILILESIQDPGNLGTIIRSAEAAGVTAVIMGGDTCDIFNPKVVRSTMGGIFRVPFIYVDDLAETINTLKENGVTIYGAHLNGENIYRQKFASKAAFLIGNEGNGLSNETSATADKLLKIPMAGEVESLNAAVSATLVVYEFARQKFPG